MKASLPNWEGWESFFTKGHKLSLQAEEDKSEMGGHKLSAGFLQSNFPLPASLTTAWLDQKQYAWTNDCHPRIVDCRSKIVEHGLGN